MDLDCKPLNELRKQLIVLSKTTKNSSTVIFKCINIIDQQRFDITIINTGLEVNIRNFSSLDHEFLIQGTFYRVSNNIILQLSKGGLFDIQTAIRKRRFQFCESTIRCLLRHMLSVFNYFQTACFKPFKITISDIIIFKTVNSINPDGWTFKLKNCFLENQYDDLKRYYKLNNRYFVNNTTNYIN